MRAHLSFSVDFELVILEQLDLLDELEELGVVGPSQGGGREREVLLEPGNDDKTGDEAL